MAGIDKIVATREQGRELCDWVMRWMPEYSGYFNEPPRPKDMPTGLYSVCNLPVEVDRLLWQKCPLPWVRARLREQYRDPDSRLGPGLPVNEGEQRK